MVSLLLIAFSLQLVVHIVNTVGASTINELVSLQHPDLYQQDCSDLTDKRSYGSHTPNYRRRRRKMPLNQDAYEWKCCG